MAKFKKSTIKTGADGVKRETEQVFSSKYVTPPFCMTFLPTAAAIYNITHPRDFHVLFKLVDLAEYNTGRVLFPTPIRQEALAALRMKSQQLSNCLRRLKKLGIIAGNAGMFLLNPQLFWRGTTLARDTAMKPKDDALKAVEPIFDNPLPASTFNQQ